MKCGYLYTQPIMMDSKQICPTTSPIRLHDDGESTLVILQCLYLVYQSFLIDLILEFLVNQGRCDFQSFQLMHWPH
jgi:hypothetical protein